MGFTNLTGFPYSFTTTGNVAPVTYRDAASLMEQLETIKQWINETMVPDTNGAIENAITEFQAGILNAETVITANLESWENRYNAFINNFVNEIKLLNNAGVAGMVTENNNAVRNAIVALINAESTAIRNDLKTYTDNAAQAVLDELETVETELKGSINGHGARHGYGQPDAITVDSRQITEPVRDWVRNALASAPTTPFRILFLGDSQTADGGLERPTLQPEEWGGGTGYNFRLGNLLTKEPMGSAHAGNSVSTNNAPGAHTWHAAIAGGMSGTYAPSGMINNAGVIAPHLVTHNIGTNDYANQISPVTFKANVLKAIADIFTVAPQVRQVLMVPWARINPATVTFPWSAYEAALYEIAEQYKNDNRFALYDFGAKWRRTGSASYTSWAGLLPDGIHAAPEVHKAIAEDLAVWMGLPSPTAVFGPVRRVKGSVIQSGNRVLPNAAARLTVPSAPIKRSVTVHVRTLATVAAETDIIVEVDKLNGTSTEIYPFHVQAASQRSYDYSFRVEMPAHESWEFRLGCGVSFTFDAGSTTLDRFNQFWAEVTYI